MNKMNKVMPARYSVAEFLQGLAQLSPRAFTLDAVHEFLKAHPLDPASLKPYLFFRATHYTRNLMDRRELYEVLAICWEPGQKSHIHNHRGQNCWMAVPIGRLLVQNYRVAGGQDGTEFCQLAESGRYWMDPSNPGRVEPEEPIHYVSNPAGLGQPAVSVHIYSRPYDSCTVYFPEQNRSLDVPLHYSSKFGVVVPEEQ